MELQPYFLKIYFHMKKNQQKKTMYKMQSKGKTAEKCKKDQNEKKERYHQNVFQCTNQDIIYSSGTAYICHNNLI